MTTLDNLYHFWPQTPTQGSSPREIHNVGRDDLAQLFAQLEFTRGVEIGTEYGIYAETLCKANPSLKLHCVDPYLAYKDYRDHVSQPKLDSMYEETKRKLRDYNTVMIRMTSVKAAAEFPNDYFDFVYLDGNHSLPYVIADLTAWTPKVRRGGIIAGHDFIRRNNRLRYQCHVVEAVFAYTQCYMIEPWFILGTKAEFPDRIRDVIRSFMWVNQ